MLQDSRLFPLAPFNALRSMNRLLDSMVDPFRGATDFIAPAFPAINLWEDGEALRAEAEVPGLKMNDIEILVVGNELTIKGRRPDAPGDGATWHRQERGTGEFRRVLAMPFEVDSSRVEATLKDGVLSIVMPKAESARARKIEVKMA